MSAPTPPETPAAAETRPSRAHAFRDLVAGLARLDGVRGGLLVTPDGLVVTSVLPPGAPVEALAALGATLGRQLELGTARFAQGPFRTAVFGADDGVLLVGGSHIGFVVLLGERSADPAALRAELGDALDRLTR